MIGNLSRGKCVKEPKQTATPSAAAAAFPYPPLTIINGVLINDAETREGSATTSPPLVSCPPPPPLLLQG